MELKPGYKLTEVGLIPEDWEVSRLADLGEVIRGASPRPKGDKRFYGGSIPRLMVQDVTRDGKIVFPQIDFLTEEGAKRSRPCKQGTLTIVCSGTIGIPSFLGVDACIHDGFLALVGSCRSVSDDYVYHQLCRLRESFDSLATHGGIFTNLTTSGVKEFTVPLPPTKVEQDDIAQSLSDADALIESLEELIAKKRHIKHGALQELLTGKKRLPGFRADWEVKRFGDLVQPRKERIDPRKTVAHEFCIELEHIQQGSGRLAGSSATGEGSSLKSAFQAGDVLFGKLRSYLRKYWLADRSGVCSTEIWVLMAKLSQVTPDFLFHLITVDRFIQTASTAYGTHMPRSDWNVVKNYDVALPGVAEQTAIAAILSGMDGEIAALEAKLAKARQIKQGMMQDLLTGRIRLV